MVHRSPDCNPVLWTLDDTMKWARPGRMNRRRFLRWAFGLTTMAAADAFAWEPEWVRVRTIRLTTGTPGFRFVQFTDVHHKGNRAYLQSVVAKINQLSPRVRMFYRRHRGRRGVPARSARVDGRDQVADVRHSRQSRLLVTHRLRDRGEEFRRHRRRLADGPEREIAGGRLNRHRSAPAPVRRSSRLDPE